MESFYNFGVRCVVYIGCEGNMTKAKTRPADQISETDDAPTLRERIELILFIAVEVLCLLLFIDFLFIGFYIK
jgi:hypothetical protein